MHKRCGDHPHLCQQQLCPVASYHVVAGGHQQPLGNTSRGPSECAARAEVVRRIVECTLHATTCDSCAAARGAKPSSSCWLPRTHRCAAGVRGWCSVAMARQCVDRGAGAGAPPEATTTRWRTPAVRGLFRRWKCTEGGACRDSHSHAAAAAATAAAAAALGLRRPLLVRRSLALPCPALAPVAAVAPGSSLPSLPEVPSEVSPCSKVHRGHRHAVAVLTL